MFSLDVFGDHLQSLHDALYAHQHTLTAKNIGATSILVLSDNATLHLRSSLILKIFDCSVVACFDPWTLALKHW